MTAASRACHTGALAKRRARCRGCAHRTTAGFDGFRPNELLDPAGWPAGLPGQSQQRRGGAEMIPVRRRTPALLARLAALKPESLAGLLHNLRRHSDEARQPALRRGLRNRNGGLHVRPVVQVAGSCGRAASVPGGGRACAAAAGELLDIVVQISELFMQACPDLGVLDLGEAPDGLTGR